MSINTTKNLRVLFLVILVLAVLATVAVVALGSFDASLLHHGASSTVDVFSSMGKAVAGGCNTNIICPVGT